MRKEMNLFFVGNELVDSVTSRGYRGARKGGFLAKPAYLDMLENLSKNHLVLACPERALQYSPRKHRHLRQQKV